jgi:hypothetical protein
VFFFIFIFFNIISMALTSTSTINQSVCIMLSYLILFQCPGWLEKLQSYLSSFSEL